MSDLLVELLNGVDALRRTVAERLDVDEDLVELTIDPRPGKPRITIRIHAPREDPHE